MPEPDEKPENPQEPPPEPPPEPEHHRPQAQVAAVAKLDRIDDVQDSIVDDDEEEPDVLEPSSDSVIKGRVEIVGEQEEVASEQIDTLSIPDDPGSTVETMAMPVVAATHVGPVDELDLLEAVDEDDQTEELSGDDLNDSTPVAQVGKSALPEPEPEPSPVPEPATEPVPEPATDVPADIDEDVEELGADQLEDAGVHPPGERDSHEEITEIEDVGDGDLPPVMVGSSSPPSKPPLPPASGGRPDSLPPSPPLAAQRSVVVDDAPAVVAIPEEDVRRDYKVVLERKALETAAEIIPEEFLVEEGAVPPRPPRPKRTARPKRWYEEIFGDDYLQGLPRLSDFQMRRELDFIEKGLGLRPGAMVLDLACGHGMQAIGMARRGYQVVGLDLSVAMLAIAGEDAQAQEQKINFLHGDMRDLKFGPTFDGVYCIGSSFGFFDEENNLKVLSGVYSALKPGGVFLLDVDNRDYVMRGQPSLLWYEGDGFVAMEETSFDFISSRLSVKRTMLMDQGGKAPMEYSIRIYSLHELGNMLHKVGFAVASVGGHRAARRAFLGEESPKIIISSIKREEEPAK